jgi:hypothetical protein
MTIKEMALEMLERIEMLSLLEAPCPRGHRSARGRPAQCGSAPCVLDPRLCWRQAIEEAGDDDH